MAIYQITFLLFFRPSLLTVTKIAALWYGVPASSISLRELARYALDQHDITLYTLTLGVRFLALIHCTFVQEHELEDEDVVQIIKKI